MKWLLFFVVAFLTGCARDTARVSGRFTGHTDGTVYLEQVVPGDQRVVDSTSLSGKGDFRFRVRLTDNWPTLYNLRYRQGAIPLMLSAGERVRVESMCDVALNYTVEGSEESERIRELQMLLIHGGLKLDSIRQVVFGSAGEEQRASYGEYMRELNRVRREHLLFIAREPGRLSSLYALYQRLAGEQHLLAADRDIVYYRIVADSTAVVYPGSPYVSALQREVEKADRAMLLAGTLMQKWEAGGDGYPELTLPDIYGNEHKLSDLQGNVIVVDFWHSADPSAALKNGEMKLLYEALHDRGLEVYQVSLDTQKAMWVAAVQDQKLPWVSVGDMLGVKGPAATSYNVARLPANFIIGRDGTVAARDLFGDELAKKVNELL